MPKSKQPKKRRVAPVQKEVKQVVALEPIRVVLQPLVMEERDRLTSIFNDPAFRKAWKNMRALRPSSFVATGAELGNQAAINRFHEQRGWEAFEAAFLAQADEPKPRPTKPVENFPEGGTIDAAFRQPPKP